MKVKFKSPVVYEGIRYNINQEAELLPEVALIFIARDIAVEVKEFTEFSDVTKAIPRKEVCKIKSKRR